MLQTWLDRLLLGREAVERSVEAEERIARADKVRAVLDAHETAELNQLAYEADEAKRTAQRACADSTRPMRQPSLPEFDLERGQ